MRQGAAAQTAGRGIVWHAKVTALVNLVAGRLAPPLCRTEHRNR
jgi:hypothetical protein